MNLWELFELLTGMWHIGNTIYHGFIVSCMYVTLKGRRCGAMYSLSRYTILSAMRLHTLNSSGGPFFTINTFFVRLIPDIYLANLRPILVLPWSKARCVSFTLVKERATITNFITIRSCACDTKAQPQTQARRISSHNPHR